MHRSQRLHGLATAHTNTLAPYGSILGAASSSTAHCSLCYHSYTRNRTSISKCRCGLCCVVAHGSYMAADASWEISARQGPWPTEVNGGIRQLSHSSCEAIWHHGEMQLMWHWLHLRHSRSVQQTEMKYFNLEILSFDPKCQKKKKKTKKTQQHSVS